MDNSPTEQSAWDIVRDHVFFRPRQGQDWQSKPELPTAQEILAPQNPEGKIDLPENPVDKPWASKGEYLTTQYEILRREAIEGLRFSVSSYIELRAERKEMMDDDHTCVYTKVRVRQYLFSTIGPIARVSFSTERSRYNIQWQQSKRLQPGKIVALSTRDDGFQSICKIASIAQRPYRNGLDQDPPLVDLLWANPEDAVLDPDLEMIMIESWHGYYEAARHALVGLQHAARTNSPLDKYLTGAQTRDKAPEFIETDPCMNFSALAHNATKEDSPTKDSLRMHDIIHGGVPDLRGLTLLDDSQLLAVHRIVSNELAIVQGPPGTGKTFTSVEAIKVMVENRRRHRGPPIIVAAQTNHALDQLLMHCIDFGANVLRMGGRTQNEVIQKRTLYHLRLAFGSIPADRKCSALDRQRHKNIDDIWDLVHSLFGDRLLDPAALLKFGIISEAQFNSLCDETMETQKTLESNGPFALWLGDSLIPAKILRDQHQSQCELSEAQARKDLEEFEYDGEEVENIADEEEDENRFRGRIIELKHVWSGKVPANLSSWNRAVARALAKDDLYEVGPELRGAVYQHLQARLLEAMTPRFAALLAQNIELCKQRKAFKFLGNTELAETQRIDIVGCTTTGLTKYRGCLAAMKPLSLLIEEAAETREANIASALYPSVQQLILVGDHKQLAPKCDIHWLGDAPYNLNVSMFQRMVNLGMPFVMLNQQRRMKPELRFILQPFYPDLVDHASVESLAERPDVPGMGGRNCWLFDHTWPEDTNSDFSKFNEQEADMITNFFAYLVSNGTRPEKITVLTFYKGQRKVLLTKLKRHPSLIQSTFNVCTVDSYQGEENDVVILSLVRSPQVDRSYAVGFLEDERRAVVAISRARRGFYVFGNVENVLRAHDASFNLWSKICSGFAEQERMYRAGGLPVVCQPHGRQIWIKEVDDWGDNAGGCDLQCQESRPCGHQCTLKCHPIPHEQLSCSQPCRNTLPCGHGCQRRCSQECFCDCKLFQEMSRQSQLAARERLPLEQRLIQMGGQQTEMLMASMKLHKTSYQQPRISQGAVGGGPSAAHQEAPRVDDDQARQSVSNRDPIPGLGLGQIGRSAAARKQFVRNVVQDDRRLSIERERCSTAAHQHRGVSIKEVYQPVSLVDGRRVESEERTFHHVRETVSLAQAAPSPGHPGVGSTLLTNVQSRLQNLSVLDGLVHHGRGDHQAIMSPRGGHGSPGNNGPNRPNPQRKQTGHGGKAARRGKASNATVRKSARLMKDVGWIDYDSSGEQSDSPGDPGKGLSGSMAHSGSGTTTRGASMQMAGPHIGSRNGPAVRTPPTATVNHEAPVLVDTSIPDEPIDYCGPLQEHGVAADLLTGPPLLVTLGSDGIPTSHNAKGLEPLRATHAKLQMNAGEEDDDEKEEWLIEL